jgi:arylsulfatase A-like enzyme
MPAEAHYTRWVGDESIDFLRQARRPGSEEHEGEESSPKPFFLWANFFDPHHPFVAPREYLDRYDPATLPLPLGQDVDLARRPPILTEASERGYAGHARGYAEHSREELREIVRAYYAMVSFVDDEVGRILATLDQLGLRQNTLVVFTSDHGEMLGDHRLLLKGPMMYEGAVRVPLIMRWPGTLAGGARREALVSLVDLCPAFLAAAGQEDLPTSQGASLLPVAQGESGGRGYALCEYRDSGHPYDPPVHVTMLRRGRHKLVLHHGDPATARQRTGELYDLGADPQELTNLWDAPQAQALRAELQEYLLDALVATEDRTQPRQAPW